MPDLEELAEHTEAHLLARAGFEAVRAHGCVYIAGRRDANLHPYAVDDLDAAVAWSREETRRRGLRSVEWWVGWTAEPRDLAEGLLARGVKRSNDPPTLTGMTCTTAPPEAPHVQVRRIETLDELLEALEVDWDVWQIPEEERVARRETEIAFFDEMTATGTVHEFTASLDELLDALEVDWDVWQIPEEERVARRETEIAFFDEMTATGTVHEFTASLDGRVVGFGRAIDMADAVALFGGAVLPDARGRGAYRALVRARWEHAVARGTPALVVQAGPMSAPVLDGLKFERHGEIELYMDRL